MTNHHLLSLGISLLAASAALVSAQDPYRNPIKDDGALGGDNAFAHEMAAAKGVRDFGQLKTECAVQKSDSEGAAWAKAVRIATAANEALIVRSKPDAPIVNYPVSVKDMFDFLDAQLAAIAQTHTDPLTAKAVAAARAFYKDVFTNGRKCYGIIVVRCNEQTSTDPANLQPGDIVVKLNGKEIHTADNFKTAKVQAPGAPDANVAEILRLTDGKLAPVTLKFPAGKPLFCGTPVCNAK